MKRRLILTLALVAGCERSPGPPLGPEPVAAGPAPVVRVTNGFGDAPVEGEVRLVPPVGSSGWTYAVDLDLDGRPEYRGTVERDVGLLFRFDRPGPHRIQAQLLGPDTLQVEHTVVVNDPSRVRTLATGRVEPLDALTSIFEGIAISPDGRTLYVGDFHRGAIAEVDAVTFATRRWLELPYGVEGLSVSPDGTRLFATFKYGTLAWIDTATYEIVSLYETFSANSFYVRAIDDRRALIAGGSRLRIVDASTGDTLSTTANRTRHFDASRAGDRVAAILAEPREIQILSLPTLQPLATVSLPGLWPQLVAFSDDGESLHVLAYELGGTGARLPVHLLTVNVTTSRVEKDVPVQDFHCGLCVANPAAIDRSGRYVVFEWDGGGFVYDTRVNLPIARANPAGWSASVAASPTEDATFFLLDGGGGLVKIRVEP